MAKYTRKVAAKQPLQGDDRAIKFNELHPSEDSKKAVSAYYKINILKSIPIAISLILGIILVFLTTSANQLSIGVTLVFLGFIVGIPVIFIPLNLIIAKNSYGKIWYDFLDWYTNEIDAYVDRPDFSSIVENKYFKEVDHKSNELDSDMKKRYDAEIIKLVLGSIFLIMGLVIYIYLMFKTTISFMILTLIMIVFAAVCIYLIGDASAELRKIKVFGNDT